MSFHKMLFIYFGSYQLVFHVYVPSPQFIYGLSHCSESPQHLAKYTACSRYSVNISLCRIVFGLCIQITHEYFNCPLLIPNSQLSESKNILYFFFDFQYTALEIAKTSKNCGMKICSHYQHFKWQAKEARKNQKSSARSGTCSF